MCPGCIVALSTVAFTYGVGKATSWRAEKKRRAAYAALDDEETPTDEVTERCDQEPAPQAS